MVNLEQKRLSRHFLKNRFYLEMNKNHYPLTNLIHFKFTYIWGMLFKAYLIIIMQLKF